MREVFASINYVINKLEEKNLFKIAQEGHDIFAAMYRFIRDKQNGLMPAMTDEEIDENLEKVTPLNLSDEELSVLYGPGTKTRNRNWRVKLENGHYIPTNIQSESPSSSEAPSAGSSVAPESASTTTSTMPGPGTSSITVTTPSSYSGTEGTSSESSSATGTPQGSGPSFSTGSGASTGDPTKVEYFDIKTLLRIVDYLKIVSKASDLELIEKLKLDKTIVSKALDVLIKLGAIKYNNYNYQFIINFFQNVVAEVVLFNNN